MSKNLYNFVSLPNIKLDNPYYHTVQTRSDSILIMFITLLWQYKNSSTKRDLEINLSWGRSASHRYTLLSTIQGQWKVQKFEGTQQSTDCSHRLSFTLGGVGGGGGATACL